MLQSTIQNPRSPLVSIVILNWDKAEMTADCVRRVEQHTGDIDHETIVVDNGSRPEQFAKLTAALPATTRLISLNENLFFGEANNIGVEAAAGKYILLLNNDAQVGDGYLAPLLRVLTEAYSAGAVGPKFLNADGSVQEAGAFVFPDGTTFQHGRHGMQIADRFSRGAHIVDYCSAACLLMERDVYLELGGFDPLFDPAYFEDVDLMFRLRAKGRYTYYCADTAVCHLENVTSRELWSAPKLNAVAGHNHQRFFARWSDYLRRRLSEDIEPPPLPDLGAFETTPPARSRTALLASAGKMEISDTCRQMLRMASALQDHYAIRFATREICSVARIRSLCRHYDIRLGSASISRLTPELLAAGDQVVLFGDAEAMSEPDVRVHRASAPGLLDALLAASASPAPLE